MKRWKGDSGGLGLVRELPAGDDEMPTHCAEERRGELSRRRRNFRGVGHCGEACFRQLKDYCDDFGSCHLGFSFYLSSFFFAVNFPVPYHFLDCWVLWLRLR